MSIQVTWSQQLISGLTLHYNSHESNILTIVMMLILKTEKRGQNYFRIVIKCFTSGEFREHTFMKRCSKLFCAR
jgi:hypothetical protein